MKQTQSNKMKIGLTVSALALTVTAAFANVAVMAYGPQRPTFTGEQPASYITFNSITNNANYGDERNFVTIKPVSDGNKDTWTNLINVVSDQEYYVRLYVHNNAAANLKLFAENTRVFASVPGGAAKRVQIDGAISANNANPKRVWDDAVFQSNKLFNLSYVVGSARYYNNHFTNGVAINDSLVTTSGALIGYDKIDGRLQGCAQYAGHLIFKVKAKVAKSPSFTIAKQVRKVGDKHWSKNITVNPGDKVEYKLYYENKGDVAQYNVIAKDFMPQGMMYQTNSLKIYNATNPQGLLLKEQDKLFNGIGLNFGNYNPNSNAGLYYAFQVPANNSLPLCGKNIFRNRAIVYTPHGNLEDKADVVVNKTNCTPAPNKPTPNQPTPNKPTPGQPQPQTPQAPANPEALPTTGPAEMLIGLIAIFLISTSVVYYFKSQKELKQRIAASGRVDMKVTEQLTDAVSDKQSTKVTAKSTQKHVAETKNK